MTIERVDRKKNKKEGKKPTGLAYHRPTGGSRFGSDIEGYLDQRKAIAKTTELVHGHLAEAGLEMTWRVCWGGGTHVLPAIVIYPLTMLPFETENHSYS